MFNDISDAAGGLIWFLLGIFLCIGSINFGLGNFKKPGPGFMPFISGSLLGILGIALTVSSIVKKVRAKEGLNHREVWVNKNWRRALCILVALFAYGFLLERVGFLVTTFLFLLFLFKVPEPKGWAIPLVISGVAVIASYFIFAVWLKSAFPKGIFGF